MTAVAAVRVAGEPAMVGDVVLTALGERFDGGYAGKIYVLAPNVAMGWSGNLSLAAPAIRRIRAGLAGRAATMPDLGRVLDGLGDLRGSSESLELTGWIVTSAGPKVIRWASGYDPVRFSDAECAIGDGGGAQRMTPSLFRGVTSAGCPSSRTSDGTCTWTGTTVSFPLSSRIPADLGEATA
jgi:hypothetical protein